MLGLESISCVGDILRAGIRSTTQAPITPAASRSKAEFLIEKQVGCIATGAFLEVLEGKTLLAFEVLAG